MITFWRLFRKTQWRLSESSDPFDHHDVKRMSLRELADLPMPRPGRRLARAAGHEVGDADTAASGANAPYSGLQCVP
jgi:hypothetical protein